MVMLSVLISKTFPIRRFSCEQTSEKPDRDVDWEKTTRSGETWIPSPPVCPGELSQLGGTACHPLLLKVT
ncbi:hypothetical protein GCM10010185_33950 [Saccharothrix coeruleofusca]|uniref:Uncharacterized protein n=1 Tax=Saccharothrix coeruleofusca TaxID=33919 RepID=A0A918AN20_9PSEU|nr:hypothetical protein GCM10010185_33950 [Saccharothrix coeruleofusca]